MLYLYEPVVRQLIRKFVLEMFTNIKEVIALEVAETVEMETYQYG
ncbi:MAG: hypothetical protein ACOX14_08225 [Fermentimonas caenicola]|jgi:hypothetical protein